MIFLGDKSLLDIRRLSNYFRCAIKTRHMQIPLVLVYIERYLVKYG